MILNNSSFLNRNIKLFYVSKFLLGLRFIAPVWVLFFSRYITFAQIGYLEVIGLLSTAILELPSGVFADLVGRKYSVALGNLIAAVGLVIIGFSQTFGAFLLGYIINSVGCAFVSGSDSALIYDTLKQFNKENIYSKIAGKGETLFRLAVVVAMVVGQFMYKMAFGLPYIALGVTTLFSALLYFFMSEPNIDSEIFTFKNYIRQFVLGAKEAFKNSKTRLVSYYFIFFASVEIILLWFYYASYLSWLGYGENNIGYIYAAIAFTRMLVSYKSQDIENKITLGKLTMYLPLVLGLSLLISGIQNIYIGSAMLFIHYSLFALRYTVLEKLINLQFVSKYRASAISTLNMIVSFTYAVVIFMGGFFIDLGNVGIVLPILGLVLIITNLPLGYLFRKSEE
jgi:MFS family permease